MSSSRGAARRGPPVGPLVAVLLATLVLAGCGFQPMYADPARGRPVSEDMARIYVAAIPDRVGQLLRNDLLDRLNPMGQPAKNRYRLEVELRSSSPPTVLSTNELASRRNFTLNATYTLRSADGKQRFLRRRYTAVTSFDIVESEFATLTARDYAEELAARQVADAIQTQLALYFSRK